MTTPPGGTDGPDDGARPFTDDRLREALARSELSGLVCSTVQAMVTADARRTGRLTIRRRELARRLKLSCSAVRLRLKAARDAGAIVAIHPRSGEPLAAPRGGRGSDGAGYAPVYIFGPALAPLLCPDDDAKGATGCALIGADGERQGRSGHAARAQHTGGKGATGCAPYETTKKKTNTKAGGGGGVSIPDGWTEADHADALAIAHRIGHAKPAGFVRRAGTLERVAWLADQTKSADNPAGAAESRLKAGEQPPAEWAERYRRQREGKRRAEAEQAEANERELMRREATLCGLSPGHLAALVEHRAAELAHPAGVNAPDRAEQLRRVHDAGRLFDDDDDARGALAELVGIGGTLAAFRSCDPQCQAPRLSGLLGCKGWR
jgi:hypothetical protein